MLPTMWCTEAAFRTFADAPEKSDFKLILAQGTLFWLICLQEYPFKRI
jgi:hypothetical protein